MTEDRTVLLVVHTGRAEATQLAREAAARLADAGVGVRLLAPDADDIGLDKAEVVDVSPAAAEGCEIVMVLGGDGTILRGAEVAHASGTPVLGVNLGHIGFLAESERDDLDVTIDHVVHRKYAVEERMTLDVTVLVDGAVAATQWALNEASVEKSARERMIEVVVEVDGRPLSRWGGDGVVAATPTGSTAYAFSAGGPVVWPELEAMLVVPLSAHALFSRPLVVSPRSVVAVELMQRNPGPGVLWCDGRRTEELPPGARVEVRHGARPVRLARLHQGPFTDRLVAKFDLPVHGWRGRREVRARRAAARTTNARPESARGPDSAAAVDHSSSDYSPDRHERATGERPGGVGETP
ncbi:NAD kinase [Actinopolymorpha rutila]|uniref:NAD kinase n=1 Tax=Actinopolymorpha rutila TaxID=446787 RepID=A0A852ZP82_9ACTN|nr:NAD+ kinase [Actinopolymorpha rutila]